MKRKSVLAVCLTTGFFITFVATGGIMAFFTDKDEVTNKFTVGKIDVLLEEPEWSKKTDENQNGIPDEAENMLPQQSIEKDPQVRNVGTNDCYLFMTVQVPVREIITVNDKGEKNPKSITELYTYEKHPNWKLLGTCEMKGETGKVEGRKHLYAYADENGKCRKVNPEGVTEPLFDKVQFVNALEGQGLENETFQMDITSYGIQTEHIGDDWENAEKIWSVLANQKELKEMYQ